MKLRSEQVAVITGAASGIGLALARELAQRGLRVMLADIETAALDAAQRELADAGFDVAAEVTDVADPAASERLADATVRRFGGIDVLVYNAGVGRRPWADLDQRHPGLELDFWREPVWGGPRFTGDGTAHAGAR